MDEGASPLERKASHDAAPKGQSRSSRHRRSTVTIKHLNLNQIHEISYGSGRQVTTPNIQEQVQTERRIRRQSMVEKLTERRAQTATLSATLESSKSTLNPLSNAADSKADVNDLIRTADNAAKFSMYTPPPSDHSHSIISSLLSLLESKSQFEMAPFFRYSLFILPVFVVVLLIVNFFDDSEYWSYITYAFAPLIMVSAGMHAMCRPKRRRHMNEEKAMVSISCLIPLMLNVAGHIKHMSDTSSLSYLGRWVKIVTSAGAFFLVVFAGSFIAKRARNALAFQSDAEVLYHLQDKVFLGGASMLISILYLVLESFACIIAYAQDADVDAMLKQCDGVKGPNYAVGIHLSSMFIYSILFAPFNKFTLESLITLKMTAFQMVEGAIFCGCSCIALFLFGGKRPGTRLSVTYESLMGSIYAGWMVIYLLELTHIILVLRKQSERKEAIQRDMERTIEEIRSKESGSTRTSGRSLMRFNTMPLPAGDVEMSAVERATEDSTEYKANHAEVNIHKGSTSTTSSADEGSSGAAAVRRMGNSFILQEVKLDGDYFARGSIEALSPRSNRAISSSATMHRSKTGEDIEEEGKGDEQVFLLSFSKIFRFCLVVSCFLELAMSWLPLFLREEWSRKLSFDIIQGCWSAWPLVATYSGSLFMSNLRDDHRLPIVETFGFVCIALPWNLTNCFRFEPMQKGTLLVKIGFHIVTLAAGLLLFFIGITVRGKIMKMTPAERDKVIRHNFNTVGYMMLPIMYLGLESIGWLAWQKSMKDYMGARSLVKVNFIACMHLFGIVIWQIYFSHFQLITTYDVLRGNTGSRITCEIVLFVVATAICLFSLATRLGNDLGDKNEDIANYAGAESLEELHQVLNLLFLTCWWTIFFIEATWISWDQVSHFLIRIRSCFACCARSESISSPPGAGKNRSGATESSDSFDSDSRPSLPVTSAPADSEDPISLSLAWRWFFSFMPLIVMPGISIMWILTPVEWAPYPFLYLAFVPVNILFTYVIFFNSPDRQGNPVLEICSYVFGGPLVLVLGGIAELRWTNLSTADNRVSVSVILVFRLVLTLLTLRFLRPFLRIRQVFARSMKRRGLLSRFVTEIVCGGALKATIPVVYICLSSLGCIIETYEIGAASVNLELSSSCIQYLSCNVGVALHLVGVCIFQPFLLPPHSNFSVADVLTFRIHFRDKVNVVLVGISSALSMSLFAWRSHNTWLPDRTMYTAIGANIVAILIIWCYVLGSSTMRVLDGAENERKRERLRSAGFGNDDPMYVPDPKGRDVKVKGREEEQNEEAQGTVGFATGEFGLGVMAPGLI